ncbi:MAG TPA: hypothetical protein VF486_22610 [Actinomycetes bacterium]
MTRRSGIALLALLVAALAAPAQASATRTTQMDVAADGRFASFVSEATNLVPHDRNQTTDVFLRGP